ncbi:MAG: RluA family pseudouridine synthase [Treponema sp.]
MAKKVFTLSADDANRRLDRVLRKFLHAVPLSGIYSAMRKGLIRINGKRVHAGYKTAVGDLLTLDSLLLKTEEADTEHQTQKLTNTCTAEHTCCGVNSSPSYSILLRTDDILVINKPAGISVHGNKSLTQQLLQNRTADPIRQSEALAFTIGPLHRLDKHTSGCICFSQSLHGAQWFSENLKNRQIVKYYLGIVEGSPSHGTIHTDGKAGTALTYYTAAAYNIEENYSLVLFCPITGRKHQIRKHAQHIGYPLVGDFRYGSTRTLPAFSSYFLHAWKLILPGTRPHPLPAQLEAPLFPDAAVLIHTLFPNWNNQIQEILACIESCGAVSVQFARGKGKVS